MADTTLKSQGDENGRGSKPRGGQTKTEAQGDDDELCSFWILFDPLSSPSSSLRRKSPLLAVSLIDIAPALFETGTLISRPFMISSKTQTQA